MPPSPLTRASRPKTSVIQAFSRGLSVLHSFDASTPEQTISTVAARTGLDRAGARRILHTLEALGYIHRDGNSFHLTPRVLTLGYAYFATTPIWVLAERVTRDLVKRINETCSIGVLDQQDVLYVVRVPAPHIVNSSFTVGSHVPAYCSSTGRVLLGNFADTKLRQVLRGLSRIKRTPHTSTSVARLARTIRTDARRGWSIVNQELELGLCSIAAPIRGAQNEVIAAISVSGSISRLGPSEMRRRILPHLKSSAAEISDCARIRPIVSNLG